MEVKYNTVESTSLADVDIADDGETIIFARLWSAGFVVVYPVSISPMK
jgi:hypothetical protein